MCHVCGGGVQLLVNSVGAGSHFSTDAVGSTSYRTEPADPTRLNFLSMILSKQTTNGSTCLDVLIIVTQMKSDYEGSPPLRIACRSPTQEFPILYQRTQSNISAIPNNTVFLSHLIGRSTIVTGKNNLVTNILLCSTKESSMFWQRNGQSVGAFNGLHDAGDSEQLLHKNDSSVLFRETILLAKRLGDITSLLVLTDFNSSVNSTISCTSNSNLIVTSYNDSYVSPKDASNMSTTSPVSTTGSLDDKQGLQETTTKVAITEQDKGNVEESSGLKSKLCSPCSSNFRKCFFYSLFRLGDCSDHCGSSCGASANCDNSRSCTISVQEEVAPDC